ncbi:hypothetical protein RPMA_20435 [Tardiphaga alba]|uniref:Integral membrane protein n=1 Tax=Tardiphaga alba TaxID=340268 RepID=A0ABX8ACF6_9BRAD|nr:hypothetical protein [Tardiphaga alba]QUS40942.1 hypothetical protein RPMA_20435 [Tardiphaga alba]
MITPSLLLRRAIQIDAVVSGAMALLLTLATGLVAGLTQLPAALLLESGLFLIAYVALIGWLGTRDTMPRLLVLAVIIGNAAWTLGSIGLLFSGAVSPNLLGQIFVAMQAVAVGVFAELQFIGLRKSSAVQTA